MMRIRFRFFFLVPLFAAVLFAGCRSPAVLVDEPEFMKTFNPGGREFPQGFRFLPAPVPVLDIPPDVGTLFEYPSADSGDPVALAFREAYVEALFRGLPLEGVLGGDRVHFWPSDNPQGRIQNWTSGAEEANSWGFPGLVLAIGSAGNPGEAYRVYTVSGRILDRYGRSPGPNIENGVAGYGYPIGDLFFRDGAAVQYFSKGSIVAGKTGTVFIPSAGLDPAEADPDLPERGNVSNDGLAPEIAGAFSAAVQAVLGAESTERSDGPVFSVIFSDPWIIPGPGIPVSGIYVKSYDAGESIFVYVDAPALPKRARFLTGSFLTVLLRSGKRISGAENETPTAPVSGVGSPFIKALLEGFSLYGVPLSDRLAVEAAEPGSVLFQEAQRFSKGWIIAPPLVTEAAAENEPVADD
ncbi:MAG: hypothetical protein LBP69_06540, partial [Treponema sp.]|nr:hypothetical protein [Treponema sp.]